MPTLSPPAPRRKVYPPSAPGHRWVVQPAPGCTAVIEIGKTWYDVRPIADRGRLVGFRLVKHDDGQRYDLDITTDPWACDCGDGTFRTRPGGCKHAAELRAALAEIGRSYALPPAPRPEVPALLARCRAVA